MASDSEVLIWYDSIICSRDQAAPQRPPSPAVRIKPGQRSKKPTMAREWRKLKEKQKHEKEAVDQLAVERMEVDTTPELSPPPPRAKYVPPVFKENEYYSDRQDTFLRGAWPHNNKKGIPTPSELAEAGFFFIGPGDYCRWGSAAVTRV